MAKRSKKKSPRREQPWVQAARDRLRAKVEVRVATETSDAFLDLARPLIRAIPSDARDQPIDGVLDLARLAWNLPLLHAISTEPGSDGARIRAHAERVLPRLPAHRRELALLFAARTEELRDLGRPILDVFARTAEESWQILVMTGDEEMAHARATRFSYDPRVIVATSSTSTRQGCTTSRRRPA